MNRFESGQALIILIFAIALAITILTGVTLAAITLNKNTRLTETAQTAYYGAESGAEYALMKLIRDPSSCGGPTDSFPIDSANVTVTYSLVGTNCTISVVSNLDTILKKLQVQATISGSKVIPCCWKEQP